MKNFIAGSFFSILLFSSCSKDIQEQQDDALSINAMATNVKQNAMMSFDRINIISNKIEEIRVQQQTFGLNKVPSECSNTVFVPDDYPTIQEAIFAVCENGNVLVRSGIYNESPAIFTPRIFVKAIGDVTLKGGFGLAADNVKIHGFKIDNAYSQWSKVGIASAPGFNGFDIKHNTIYSTNNINTPGLPFGHIGIYFEYCDNARIVQNTISGNMEVGIYIDAIRLDFPGSPPHPFGSSNNNTISNNTVTDIFGDLDVLYPGTCIQLRGDTDNTVVEGNYTENTNGWGISLWSSPELEMNCDGNIVKNNVAKNNSYIGFEIHNGGSNNTLGPNNESYYNSLVGILLHEFSSNNHVFNCTSLNNGLCDVVNYGIDNTFQNIESGCTFGVD